MEHTSHVMLISRWQILLLILMLVTSCSAQSTYYITPTPDTPCPGEPCHTLSEYAAGNNLPVNTTMEFLPGNHTLEQTISVTNLPRLTLHGDSSSLPEITSRIKCTWPAGFVFTDITELYISAMAFISCGHCSSEAADTLLVQQCNLSNCSFHNNINADDFGCQHCGGALYIENSNATLTMNKFQDNTAAVGGALTVEFSILNLTMNTFHNNSAFSGGAVHMKEVVSTIIENTLQNNSAVLGGAISMQKGNFIITENIFQNNSADGGDGGVLFTFASTLDLIGNIFQNNFAYRGAILISDSHLIFIGNTFQNNFAAFGGVLYVLNSILTIQENIFQNNSAEHLGGIIYVLGYFLHLTENTFQDSSAEVGGALYVVDGSLIVTGNTFLSNAAGEGGALYASHSILSLSENTFQNCYNTSVSSSGAAICVEDKSTLRLSGNTFHNNSAGLGGSVYLDASSITFTGDYFTHNYAGLGGAIIAINNSMVKIYSVTIEHNRAGYGGGMVGLNSRLEVFEDTVFENNTASYGGGLYVHKTTFNGSAVFTENSATNGGGAIYASSSTLFLINKTMITNNSAMDGGGLLLSGDSKLFFRPDIAIHFIGNSAQSTGGAIKVEESNPLTYCIPTKSPNIFDTSSSDCFFQSDHEQYLTVFFSNISDMIDSLIINYRMYFDNNSAVEAGADLHGGSVDICKFNNINFVFNEDLSMNSISGSSFDFITRSENKPAISSAPLHICTCRDSITNCTGSYHPEPVYPGGTLEVPVIALGQRNGTTAAVIQVVGTSNNIRLGSLEYSQKIDSSCNILKYAIHSRAVGTTQEMTLYAQGPCSPTQTNTLTVTVNIQHCPRGFQLSMDGSICICAERLQRFTNTCSVDSTTVLRERNAEFWVGYDSGNESRGLILHRNCPFDYCTSQETYLAVGDSDKQCSYNRSGLLCGRCGENLSLALGSSRCLQCSNSYLSLLLAFAFAGVALVLFLLVLRLTVAAGTINGSVIYANIVAVNSAIFFQPQITNVPTRQTANVLSVFIAWLNLDLGIETCFYNGMDAYVKSWLQFLFPLYVWALVGMIIVGSYYSGRVARVFGRNPIAVLATLFLLSYAKLLRTVIATLSYTSLEYPNNTQIAVWLYDGNVRYLGGKHIPLFIAAMVCLIFLFLPYTMLLFFSQWLQAKSHLRIFSRINSRYVKPFLDAYHAPYTDKRRYWTGLMLLLRFVLFLISAVNVLGDPSVNLLAIASITAAIPPIILGSRIYKTWSLGFLETSFIFNLTILAVATLYTRLSGGNQNAVTFTSVGIAFATFTGIVIYHSVQQIKDTRLWRSVSLKRDSVRVPLTDLGSGTEKDCCY